MTVVELFAGAGGWSCGLRELEIDSVGIEIDEWAWETADTAGHLRIRGDVRYEYDKFTDVEGLIASPPCQTFSKAGNGAGRKALKEVMRGVGCVVAKEPLPEFDDPRTALVLEPLRWVLKFQPEWVALEQVPSILPVWETYSDVMRDMGYSVFTSNSSMERWGVPQARSRAMLLASRITTARTPRPSHSRWYPREPERRDNGLPAPITAAAALGWEEIPEGRIVDSTGYQTDPKWIFERPATTVTSGPMLFHPGDREERTGRNDGISITDKEAGVLQTFRADYPWCGQKKVRHRQIGDAVPPLFARQVIQQLVGGL